MATQSRQSYVIGFLPTTPQNVITTFALNAAANWFAFGIVVNENKTLNTVKAFVSAVTGGPMGANDLTCDVYSNNAGVPNTSLSSTNTVTSPPSGAGWVEFTGLTQALTAGTQYWLVLKNVNAAPTTTFPTYRYGLGSTGHLSQGYGSASVGWGSRSTINSGSTWTNTATAGAVGVRLGFSDSTYDGTPFSNIVQGPSGVGVYSTNEHGSQFTTPAGVILNVAGISMPVVKTGTPTGNPVFKLYTGASPSLQATTNALVTADVLTSINNHQAYFSTPYALQPSTVTTVTLAETAQGDASANRFNSVQYTVENDANSRALMSFGGMVQAYFSGTWATDNTLLVPVGLILDSTTPFTAISGCPGLQTGWTVFIH